MRICRHLVVFACIGSAWPLRAATRALPSVAEVSAKMRAEYEKVRATPLRAMYILETRTYHPSDSIKERRPDGNVKLGSTGRLISAGSIKEAPETVAEMSKEFNLPYTSASLQATVCAYKDMLFIEQVDEKALTTTTIVFDGKDTRERDQRLSGTPPELQVTHKFLNGRQIAGPFFDPRDSFHQPEAMKSPSFKISREADDQLKISRNAEKSGEEIVVAPRQNNMIRKHTATAKRRSVTRFDDPIKTGDLLLPSSVEKTDFTTSATPALTMRFTNVRYEILPETKATPLFKIEFAPESMETPPPSKR